MMAMYWSFLDDDVPLPDSRFLPGWIVEAVGRNQALTSRIDGITFMAIRPIPHAVNPWRHVATRQKHFHHSSWSMFGRDGHVSFNMALRADEFVAAHTNCRWGV